ncbi:MAG TPA: hypothetical protein VGP64_05885 [Polyangia bacterium]|jgi:hypothetical protein
MRVSDRRVVISVAGLLVLFTGVASAGEARHPAPGIVAPPAGVPAAYVLTHSGWFHPSCVVRVGSDETVGADMVVRGRHDGARHFSFGPCAYQRFDLRGRAMGAGAPAHPAPEAAPAVYDGYIVYYQSYGGITAGSTLVTEEIVPPAPTNVANQDIAFFNDILTSLDDILQPVLDFNGETPKKWSIESEHCCLNNNDMQSTIMVVAPGDLIRGTVTGTGCGSNGVCSAWAISTLDVTSGKSTTLNTTAPNGVPNGVSPASLETYGVMSCDMFPVGGETTFTGNTLTAPDGTVQTLKYQLLNFPGNGVDPEVPTNCGYAGETSGNDFTLIYGPVTTGSGGAGGTSTGGAAGGGGRGAGGAAGASGRGGAGGHAGAGGAGGRAGAGGRGATGGSPGSGGASTGGASGTGGLGATGGTTGSGGVTATGGATGAGGAAGSGDITIMGAGGAATGAGGDAGEGASAGGCSCDAGGNPAPGFTLVFAFVAATLWARGRRRS